MTVEHVLRRNPGGILITGGNRGIGAHLARGLAANGWPVAVWGRREDVCGEVASSIEAAGGSARAIVANVLDAGLVSAAVDVDVAQYGSPAVLVNAAGLIEREPAAVWDMPVDEFHRVIAVNVLGPFHTIRAVGRHMRDAGGGVIVNLNSGAATDSRADRAAYTASKAALFRLGGAVAAGAGEHGVRCFELSPGVVHTAMTESMPEHTTRESWTDPQDVVGLVHAAALGQLDAWNGRMLRAGVDTVAGLADAAEAAGPRARDLGLISYGDDDPLGV